MCATHGIPKATERDRCLHRLGLRRRCEGEKEHVFMLRAGRETPDTSIDIYSECHCSIVGGSRICSSGQGRKCGHWHSKLRKGSWEGMANSTSHRFKRG
eukprot:6456520-Amphidinium_carterae.1